MNKYKKSKKKRNIILISVILLALGISIISLVISLNKERTTTYYYSEDFGSIKTTFKERGIFNLFQQAVTFQQTEIEVGETVQLIDNTNVDSHILSSVCFLGAVDIFLTNTQASDTVQFGVTINPGIQSGDYSTIKELTDAEVGIYTGETIYGVQECDIDGTNCIGSSTTCGGQSWTEQSTNSVTVTQVTTTCQNNNVGSWVENEIITGGKIEKRDTISYSNPPTCSSSTTTDYRTICDEGYELEGTNGNQGPADGQLNCELIINEDGEDCIVDGCSNNQICNEETLMCEDPECDVNLEETCSDGTTILLKECINGIWGSETGNSCVDSNTTSSNNTGTNNTQTNETLQGSNQNTKEDEINYFTIIAWILSILLAIGLVYLVYRFIKNNK